MYHIRLISCRDLIQYVTPLLDKKRYSKSHFDDVISLYREKELIHELVPPHIESIFGKLRRILTDSYGKHVQMMAPHVIDLHKDGHIGE
jgi:hypothetical protein